MGSNICERLHAFELTSSSPKSILAYSAFLHKIISQRKDRDQILMLSDPDCWGYKYCKRG